MLIKLEQLEMTEDGLRVAVLVPRSQPAKPPVRKCSGARVIETTGHDVAEVIPLRAAGGAR